MVVRECIFVYYVRYSTSLKTWFAISLFQYSRVSKFSCNMKQIFKLNQVHVSAMPTHMRFEQ